MNNVKNIKTASALGLVAVLMFGFGYALVPIYNVLCDAFGINGKTGKILNSAANASKADVNRSITVEFDTNVNSDLRWAFWPATRKITVHPGRIYEAIFHAENLTDRQITGQAIPSVAPALASLYFNKTECFCFTQQTLGPHEKKQMPVRFIIDPVMPDKVRILTLSYTFFQVAGPVKETDGQARIPGSGF